MTSLWLNMNEYLNWELKFKLNLGVADITTPIFIQYGDYSTGKLNR